MSCTRCQNAEKNQRLWRIERNPAMTWSAVEEEFPGGIPPPVLVEVCARCLTKEELVVVLAPLALFVVDTDFISRVPREAAMGVEYIRSWLRYRVGLDDLEERARKFLS